MTETQATTPPAVPVFPPGRYGRRRAPRRTPRWLVAATFIGVFAVAVAISWRLYQQYGDPLYDASVTRVTESTDTHITVEFAVNLPAGATATCTIRARAKSGEEIGRAAVEVRAAPDQRRVTATHRLPTTGPARAVDVPGCTPVNRR